MSTAHILNVEDYVPSRYVRSRLMREAGYQVTEAETVAGALQVLKQCPISLVVLDMNLPDGTGADVCLEIRKEKGLTELPVLIISATARGELDRLDGVRSGANMYLTEPVPPTVLMSTISSMLSAMTSKRA